MNFIWMLIKNGKTFAIKCEGEKMNFKSAFRAMRLGAKVKLPKWRGYWYWDSTKKTIMMVEKTKDGKESQHIDIRATLNVKPILMHMQSEDWFIADGTYVDRPDFDFTDGSFENALWWIKMGVKCSRKGWKANKEYVFAASNVSFNTEVGSMFSKELNSEVDAPILVLKTADEFIVGWTPTQEDMFAEDWERVY